MILNGGDFRRVAPAFRCVTGRHLSLDVLDLSGWISIAFRRFFGRGLAFFVFSVGYRSCLAVASVAIGYFDSRAAEERRPR